MLTGTGLRDAFRTAHGYSTSEFSWWVKRKGLEVGRRFDHAFCSGHLQVQSCRYIHTVRAEGLSDHSALDVVFNV